MQYRGFGTTKVKHQCSGQEPKQVHPRDCGKHECLFRRGGNGNLPSSATCPTSARTFLADGAHSDKRQCLSNSDWGTSHAVQPKGFPAAPALSRRLCHPVLHESLHKPAEGE